MVKANQQARSISTKMFCITFINLDYEYEMIRRMASDLLKKTTRIFN